jgi:leucyl-tRNA synthetase
MPNYEPHNIEGKWQKKWLEEKVFRANDDSTKPKYYQLETFPYPSAAGLHMGHPKGYTAEDIHARYMRMGGGDGKPKEVLYTMGWDAFGLPTENYAIKVGKNPKEVTKENTDNFRRQVRMFGLSYDWDREINTSSPEYYRWTQWLFIQLYKKGLAYQAQSKVNWCPKDQTVLANEQVIDGKCERCGSLIEERDMTQWFFKITDYAERLLNDLQGLDWPAASAKRQADWIGKSEGAIMTFPLQVPGQKDGAYSVDVFTTRPDTLFGATFVVIAPEVAQKWIDAGWAAPDDVKKYIETNRHKTERERLQGVESKTGVPAGIMAVNPANKEEIPVWIADYVLGSYGTGAIMAVPAHDERDLAFAEKFGLPVKPVLTADDHLRDSGKFDGMDSETAKWEIVKAVAGTKKTQYKIRDWSVSRQRYWGVPIPMVHCAVCGIVPVPENELPVLLPDLENYRPQGMPPLAGSPDFMNVACPKCGGSAQRDPETLDTFVDSSWYFLRYTDPHNDRQIFDPAKAKHWTPVDLYVIGAEHTVLHLLYARFITKFLHDEGLVGFQEPFIKLRHQGLILGTDGHKMSKSKGNVVNPDELVAEFGADATRMYLMFMGPFEDGAPWDSKGILGIERFLKRFWNYVYGAMASTQVKTAMHLDRGALSEAEFQKQIALVGAQAKALLHKTIKKVGEDIRAFKFNTAISAFMILLNELEKAPVLAAEDREALVKIIHPFAPHMAQELWSLMGHETYLDFELWPAYNEEFFANQTVKIVFQVNGKVRDAMEVDASVSEGQAKASALQNAKVISAMAGREPKKIIYVDKKLVNVVV